MSVLEKITKSELKETLNLGWMTHDAMWFTQSLNQLGIEQANKLNIAAVLSMAKIEIRRLKKLLNTGNISNTIELKDFFDDLILIVMPKFMKFSFDQVDEDVLRWVWEPGKCFAYRGIKKLGVVEGYQCGVLPRIQGWLEGLNIDYEMIPPVHGCQMHRTGECSVDFKISF